MATYLALWTQPEDVHGFEQEYNNDHIPLARQLPGLQRLSAAKVSDGNFYRVALLEFDSIQALREALSKSTEGQHLYENSDHLKKTYNVKVERIILEDLR